MPAMGGNAGANPVNVGAPAQSQFAAYGGVDPNIDPELAMALRISLEEERARQVDKPEDQPAAV